MKTIMFLLFISALGLKSYAQAADSAEIINLLKSDYKTLETLDYKKHMENCTEDYVLIENGEIWDMKRELEQLFTSQQKNSIRRTDAFDVKLIKIEHPFAYAVYGLRSEITKNGNTKSYHWTESAIFYKVKGNWKIKLIHSTRIDE